MPCPRTHFSPLTLVVVAVLTGSPSPAVNAGPQLAWKFKKDQVLTYVVEQHTQMKMKRGDVVRELTQSTILDASLKTIETTATGAKLTYSLDRVQMKVLDPGGAPMEYDSDKSDAPTQLPAPMLAVLETLLKVDVPFQADPRGGFTDIVYPEKLEKTIAELGPQASMAEQFSRSGLEQSIRQLLVSLPKSAVDSETPWQSSATFAMGQLGSLQYDYTHTYGGPATVADKPLEKIAVVTNITVKKSDAPGPNIGLEVEEAKGTIHFDAAAGHVATQDNLLKMQLTIATPFGTVSQDITSTTKVRLKP
jgi:hypothetical protein